MKAEATRVRLMMVNGSAARRSGISDCRRATVASLLAVLFLGYSKPIAALNLGELPAPRIIMIVVPGGWDTTLVFDDKIGAEGVTQEAAAVAASGSGGIAFVDHPDRPAVKAFFDAFGDRTTVVNGVYTEGMTNDASLPAVLGAQGAKSTKFQEFLTFYANNVERRLFPHLLMDLPLLGEENPDLVLSVSTRDMVAGMPGNEMESTLPEASTAAIDYFLAREYSTRMDQIPLGSESYKKYFQGYLNIARRPTMQAAMEQLWPTTSGMPHLTKKLLFAKRLLANDLTSAVTVGADIEGVDWDAHVDGKASQSSYFEQLFSALNVMFTSLSDDGLLDSTLVIVTGNLGRAPQEIQGNHGHWPYTSVMLYGAGMKKSVTLGRTDAYLRGVPVNPLFGDFKTATEPITFRHLFAALFIRYGIPFQSFLGKVNPFSFMLAEEPGAATP